MSDNVYIEFENRPVEDRDASVASGGMVYRDQPFALITVAGGRDVVDKELTADVLAQWKDQHPQRFASYEAWKAGQESPVNGTDIRNWPGISPAQAKTCIAANVRTLEHLAELPEDGLMRIGMGTRALQAKARGYIAAKSDGKIGEQLAAMQARLDAQDEDIRRLTEENHALAAKDPTQPARKTVKK